MNRSGSLTWVKMAVPLMVSLSNHVRGEETHDLSRGFPSNHRSPFNELRVCRHLTDPPVESR